MSRTINIAAVQMIARPASLSERLTRAEMLVVRAAQDGAQFVVLPELFNAGYEYTDENYRRAEPLDVRKQAGSGPLPRLGAQSRVCAPASLFRGGRA